MKFLLLVPVLWFYLLHINMSYSKSAVVDNSDSLGVALAIVFNKVIGALYALIATLALIFMLVI